MNKPLTPANESTTEKRHHGGLMIAVEIGRDTDNSESSHDSNSQRRFGNAATLEQPFSLSLFSLPTACRPLAHDISVAPRPARNKTLHPTPTHCVDGVLIPELIPSAFPEEADVRLAGDMRVPAEADVHEASEEDHEPSEELVAVGSLA